MRKVQFFLEMLAHLKRACDVTSVGKRMGRAISEVKAVEAAAVVVAAVAGAAALVRFMGRS